MAIIASAESTGTTFEPIPEGVHVAICYGVVDLGIQYSEKFDKKARKVQVLWELPSETFEKEGEVIPRILSKEYTLNLSEKSNLKKDLQAWRGKSFTDDELKAFDLANIINKPCQIQIIHEKKGEKVYSKIAAIMAMMKGVKVEPPKNNPIYFDLNSGDSIEVINELMNILPEWIQNKIKESETYLALKYNNEAETELADDDEIPFN